MFNVVKVEGLLLELLNQAVELAIRTARVCPDTNRLNGLFLMSGYLFADAEDVLNVNALIVCAYPSSCFGSISELYFNCSVSTVVNEYICDPFMREEMPAQAAKNSLAVSIGR